jgi:hypothetical protein
MPLLSAPSNTSQTLGLIIFSFDTFAIEPLIALTDPQLSCRLKD